MSLWYGGRTVETPFRSEVRTRCSANDWQKLTRQQRIAVCHSMAQEALERASSAHPSHKAAYQELAAQWLDLAAEIEPNSKL